MTERCRSPYFGKAPPNEDDYIRPAVDGTTSVVRAAVKHKIERVVVTSSMGAVDDPVTDGRCYGPSDW